MRLKHLLFLQKEKKKALNSKHRFDLDELSVLEQNHLKRMIHIQKLMQNLSWKGHHSQSCNVLTTHNNTLEHYSSSPQYSPLSCYCSLSQKKTLSNPLSIALSFSRLIPLLYLTPERTPSSSTPPFLESRHRHRHLLSPQQGASNHASFPSPFPRLLSLPFPFSKPRRPLPPTNQALSFRPRLSSLFMVRPRHHPLLMVRHPM